MTTFFKSNELCPVCQHSVTVTHLSSTNYMGQHSDFHRLTMGFSPLPLLMNTCPQCGYSGSAKDFSEPEAISDTFKQQIIENLQSIVTSQPLTAGRRYELFALQQEIKGAEPHELADYYLRASWAARDEGDPREAVYQQFAAQLFQKALETGEMNEADIGPVTYLIGELNRRLGHVDEAHRWFTRVIEHAQQDESWLRLAELALRQRDTPQDMM